jgi:hypothetical protein
VGLTEEYKNYRKKKIVHLRDTTDPPLGWGVIAERFGVTPGTVIYIYDKAKNEQKKKEEQI